MSAFAIILLLLPLKATLLNKLASSLLTALQIAYARAAGAVGPLSIIQPSSSRYVKRAEL